VGYQGKITFQQPANFPKGLTVDTVNGTIKGTPTEVTDPVQTYQISFTSADFPENEYFAEVNILVAAPLPPPPPPVVEPAPVLEPEPAPQAAPVKKAPLQRNPPPQPSSGFEIRPGSQVKMYRTRVSDANKANILSLYNTSNPNQISADEINQGKFKDDLIKISSELKETDSYRNLNKTINDINETISKVKNQKVIDESKELLEYVKEVIQTIDDISKTADINGLKEKIKNYTRASLMKDVEYGTQAFQYSGSIYSETDPNKAEGGGSISRRTINRRATRRVTRNNRQRKYTKRRSSPLKRNKNKNTRRIQKKKRKFTKTKK
jgi:hypothetical protein